MSKSYISPALRRIVAEQSRYRCGYCLSQEKIVGDPLNVEHIIPETAGGPTTEDNLTLSCGMCNLYKGSRVAFRDPVTEEIVRLFNPRQEIWGRHFQWTEDGIYIIGKTAVGRATVAALKLNREYQIRSRRLWVGAGWHPPKD